MRVSVVLCTYNGEDFLEEQLTSFLSQTILPDELIVSDDGSTDRTISILQEFQTNAPFPVHIYNNIERLGYAKNFLKAFTKSSGDYILFSDQDDIWLENKIERFVKLFQQDPFLALAFSNAELVDEKGKILLRDYFSYYNLISKWDNQNPSLFRYFLKNKTFINGCFMGVSAKVRTKVIQFINDYPNYELQVGHDQFISLIVAISFPDDFVREIYAVLIQHRLHQKQTIGNHFGINTPFNIKLKEKTQQKDAHLKSFATHYNHMLGLQSLLTVDKVRKNEIEKAIRFHKKRQDLLTNTRLNKFIFSTKNLLSFNYHKYTQYPLKEVVRDIL